MEKSNKTKQTFFHRDKTKKKKDPHGGRYRDAGIVPWLFLLPSLLGVLIFVLLPFLDAIRRSFFNAMGTDFVGLQNYKSVINNEAFQLAAKNTLRFTIICIPMLMILSLLLAVMITAYKDKRGFFKTSFLIPMAIPVASIAFLWKVIFYDNGLLNNILGHLGMAPVSFLHSSAAFSVLVMTYLWKNVGYDMVLWLAGLSDISPGLYEAAEIDGAGPVNQFFRITLPALRGTFFTVTVLSLLNSFKVFREAYLVAGQYPDDSIYMLQHLFNNWFLSLDVDRLCAGAVLLAIAMMVFVLIMQWIFLPRNASKGNREA